MMSKYLSLLKTLFVNTYRPSKKLSKGQIALIALAVVCLLPTLGLVCYTIYNYALIAKASGIEREFLATILTLGGASVLLLAIPSVLGYMFFSKDAELLSMLPVPKSTLFLAKFTMVYLAELILSALAMIPMLITYGVGVGAGLWYYVLVLPMVLFTPVFPLLIATVLAYPLMWVVAFFKRHSSLTTILYILGVALLFAVILLIESAMVGSEGEFGISMGLLSMMMGLYEVFIFNKLFAVAMLGAGLEIIFNFLLGALIIVAMVVISTLVCSAFFHSGMSYNMEGYSQSSTRTAKIVSTDKMNSLIIKDVKQLIRDPGFAFQSLAGLVLAPLLTLIMSGGMRESIVYTQLELAKEGIIFSDAMVDLFTLAVLSLYAIMFCGINYTASGAYTREGQTFYISKYLPVSPSLIMRAKLRFADIISIISALLTAVCVALTGVVPPISCVLLFLQLVMLSLALNGMGIRRDLKRPKLEWANVNEAFKNNFYMAVPLFISMLMGFLAPVLAIVFFSILGDGLLVEICYWAISFVVSAILLTIFRSNVTKDVDKMMESIE